MTNDKMKELGFYPLVGGGFFHLATQTTVKPDPRNGEWIAWAKSEVAQAATPEEAALAAASLAGIEF